MCSRSAISAASDSSSESVDVFFMSRSVSCTRLGGKTLTYWDCAIATSSAMRSERSNTGSPVRFLTSVIRIQSRSLNASARWEMLSCTGHRRQAKAPPPTATSAMSAGTSHGGRARGANRRGNRGARLRQVHRAEIDAKVLERLVALIRLLGQRTPEDVLKRGRRVLEIAIERRRGLVQNGVGRREPRILHERMRAGHHFIQAHAEGENVGAGIEREALELFGRHVGRGAGNLAGRGHARTIGARRPPTESRRTWRCRSP